MKQIRPYILLTPLILTGILFLLGAGNALLQSLGYIPAFGMTDLTLKYYKQVLSSPALAGSIGVSLVIAAVSSIVAAILGVLLCVALMRNEKIRGRILQWVKIPMLIPHTIAALFVVMFLSQNGLVARILYHLDIIGAQEDFPMLIYDPQYTGVILAYLWKEIPFVAYFVLALMSGISLSLGEAAQNLGASRSKAFTRITLPLSMPAISKALLIIFAFSFGAYELPFLLGATLPRALPVQAYIEYMDPDLQHRAYAMAMNGIMLVVIFGVILLYYLLSYKRSKGPGGTHNA